VQQLRYRPTPWLFLAAFAFLTACGISPPSTLPSTPALSGDQTAEMATSTLAQPPSSPAASEPAQTPSPSPTTEPTFTETFAPSETPQPTATETPIPSATATPTITLTPTFDFPDVTVQMQANCRYGPGQAYLYSHGLYTGDRAEVHGRNTSGSWLWVKPENLDRHCWVSASVVEVRGDVFTVVVFRSRLPQSTLYGPPDNVKAVRDGDLVTVTWEPVWMTEDDDRGYLIEATICQEGFLVAVAVHTDNPSYEFEDETRCSAPSSGLLYTVEKHGYTDPVPIPWP
jgi:hypothetical protein